MRRRSGSHGLAPAPAPAPRGVLALPGGTTAKLGATAGGGLARGHGTCRWTTVPWASWAQGGGAAGRRLPEASVRKGGSGPQGGKTETRG